jgi:hypothetical protein
MSTTKPPTTRKIQNAAKAYLEAKAAADRAAKELDKVKTVLLDVLHESGEKNVVLEGLGSVLLVECERTSVDLDSLAPLVNGEVFDFVTKRSIDLTAWRTALTKGMVAESVAQVVEQTSTYEQIRTSTAGR